MRTRYLFLTLSTRCGYLKLGTRYLVSYAWVSMAVY